MKVPSKLTKRVTWNKGDSHDNIDTILKVCNQLAKDGLLQKESILAGNCKYEIRKDEIIVTSIAMDNLTVGETAEIICKELQSYFFNARIVDNHIHIRFNKDYTADFEDKVKNSLSKVLKR